MNTTTTSLLSLLSLAVFICFSTTLVHAGKFIDDRGVEFNFEGTPKLATRAATGALSLYRMGARDEITTIWGLWSIRGSDLNITNPEAGSRYPDADPSVEEVNWLHTKNNMSPSCYTNPRGCFRWDNTSMVERFAEEIDYILVIDNGNDSGIKGITNITGIPVVFVDTFYEDNTGCRSLDFSANKTQCYGRSMIDIAKRIEELALAIGIDVDTTLIEQDKALMCAAAQKFTDTMKQKQEEGLRVMTSINAIKKDSETGADFFEFRTLDPIDLWVPRTLEELGMPILHHDEGSLTLEDISTRVTGDEFFVECPNGQLSEDCNDNTLYPVDFWLWDSRSYLNIIGNPEIKAIFPDKAILAGQHWHYARNDGPLSYHAIYRMLSEMTSRLAVAKRLHDPTDCSPVDPKTAVTLQVGGGLDRNEFICYNEDLIQKEYLQGCAAVDVSGSASTSISIMIYLFSSVLLLCSIW